jgi:hypothetical protein
VKFCYKCKVEKSEAVFSKNKSKKDGLSDECKSCASAIKKADRIANPEKFAAKKKAYYAANSAWLYPKNRVYALAHPEQTTAYKNKYYKNNKEACDAKSRKWQSLNKEKVAANNIEWQKNNPDKVAAKKKRYRSKPDKIEKERISAKSYRINNAEKITTRERIYRQANLGKHCALQSQRKATKLKATPSWIDRVKVEIFYNEANRLTKETGLLHCVDHIVPLRSKWVSGLHCEANLQVITASDNGIKSNRYWPNMPELLPHSLYTVPHA